jgi:hypothetical protein
MIVVVPATATAAAVLLDVYVDVPVDVDVVDVVDAAAPDIVGARISLGVIDLRTLPGSAAGRSLRAGTCTSAATTATTTTT